MTNADYIRHLTDEELCKFLSEIEMVPDGPWREAFHDAFCAECENRTAVRNQETGEVEMLRRCELDDCPEGDEILWWLRQEANQEIEV